MQLKIVTPEREIFSGTAEMATLPGSAGDFGILPGHTALFSTIDIGEIFAKAENQEYYVAVGGGFAEVMDDQITILAEAAEKAIDIDAKRAEAAKAKAEADLQSLNKEDARFQKAETALKRANNRIQVFKRIA